MNGFHGTDLSAQYDGYHVIGGIAPTRSWIDGVGRHPTYAWAVFEHDDAAVIAEIHDLGGREFDLDDPFRPARLIMLRGLTEIHTSEHPDYFAAMAEAHRQAARAFGIPGHQPSTPQGGPRI